MKFNTVHDLLEELFKSYDICEDQQYKGAFDFLFQITQQSLIGLVGFEEYCFHVADLKEQITPAPDSNLKEEILEYLDNLLRLTSEHCANAQKEANEV